MLNGIKDIVKQILGGLLGQFDTCITTATNLLSMDFLTKGGNETQTALHNAYATLVGGGFITIISATATTIVAVCFLIEFLKMSTQLDVLRFETAIKFFIKFAVAKAILDVSPDIMTAIYQKGSQIIIGMDTGTAEFGKSLKTATDSLIDGMGGLEALAFAAVMGIVFLAILVVGVIVAAISFARAIEIIMFIIISPIPCAFIPLENSQITKRFLLSFAGVVLQGVAILIILAVYKEIVSTALTIPTAANMANIGSIAYNMLLGALVLVIMVVKSGGWAKSVLNAA
jgi:hypothetical protein